MTVDDLGRPSYFRSIHTFHIPQGWSEPEPNWLTPRDFFTSEWQVTMPANDHDPGLFGSRKVSIALPDGTVYKSKAEVPLSHVSLRPLGPAPVSSKNIYPIDVRKKVQAGRPATSNDGIVEWSDMPNWRTRRGKQALELQEGTLETEQMGLKLRCERSGLEFSLAC